MKHLITLPRTIRVGGYIYDIVMDRNSDMDLHANNQMGTHSNVSQRICIDSTLKPQQTSQTFIHEFLHAVAVVYNNNDMSENQISDMAQGVFQILEEFGIRFVLKE